MIRTLTKAMIVTEVSFLLLSFNFKQYNLSEIALYVDGQQQFAFKPVGLQPDYANGLYIRAYESLFTGTGKQFRDEGLYLSREDYASGYAMYAFDR